MQFVVPTGPAGDFRFSQAVSATAVDECEKGPQGVDLQMMCTSGVIRRYAGCRVRHKSIPSDRFSSDRWSFERLTLCMKLIGLTVHRQIMVGISPSSYQPRCRETRSQVQADTPPGPDLVRSGLPDNILSQEIDGPQLITLPPDIPRTSRASLEWR